MKKLAGYRAVLAARLYKTQLGMPNLLVLTVAMHEARVDAIIWQLENVADGANAGFLFQPATEPPSGSGARKSFLSEAWARSGHPAPPISHA